MIAIGIDIGGTSTKVGYVNREGKILHSFRYKPNGKVDQDTYLKELVDMLLVENERFNNEEILGIGVGCPGAINTETGFCEYSNNLDWYSLDIVGYISKRTGLRVIVANDANAACLGEAVFGAGKNYRDMILLTIGTGIGGGLYLNDQLYDGAEGKGAELGHSKLVLEGRQCTCGAKGCVETYCSCTALISDTKAAMEAHKESELWDVVGGDINNVDAKTVWDAEALGDKTAAEVLNQYIYYLCEAMINFINIFRPGVIVLAGGLVKQGDNLMKRIIAYLEKEHYGFPRCPKVDVKIAQLEDNLGIVGAACLVFKR